MELVTFELAKKLKEKGFPQFDSYKSYFIGDDARRYLTSGSVIDRSKRAEDFHLIAAPTISKVLKWLREEKEIMFEVPITLTDDGIWKFTFRIQTKEFYDRSNYEWDTYEKSALAGIEYVLNNLI